ncbi:MAG: 4-hydroxythreonine-4-phosphate dehydrogenase PdxA [Methylophilus sp.]|nr:4-hydroxythreonine-4-phosphate dehydrogenase PdxA [Methylophilus sp.]MDP3608849.1 4-hydroxythreonine-4-phosphate dehydrogenase PdxA [Methylophilus sp.]
MNPLTRIAITAGEPAGVGLDLCVMLAHKPMHAQIVIIADQDALASRAAQINLSLKLTTYVPGDVREHAGDGSLTILHLPTAAPVSAGKLNPANSHYILDTLKVAMDGCLSHQFDAMVTAPIQKSTINDAGIAFTGHTEFLADYTQTKRVVMMLVGGGMRVALATIHLPLMQVSAAITQESLTQTIEILHQDLQQRFGIAHPKIFIAGLNPHAGEDGYLGSEEINVINPVIQTLRAKGMDLVGPLPADTMYSVKNIKEADAFLAMYHDQGLAVLKYASFGEGVNITLGLPIIRTSVDHGTALDIAGSGKVDAGSMMAAIQLAIELAKHKQ